MADLLRRSRATAHCRARSATSASAACGSGSPTCCSRLSVPAIFAATRSNHIDRMIGELCNPLYLGAASCRCIVFLQVGCSRSELGRSLVSRRHVGRRPQSPCGPWSKLPIETYRQAQVRRPASLSGWRLATASGPACPRGRGNAADPSTTGPCLLELLGPGLAKPQAGRSAAGPGTQRITRS